ncbi:hypothetical protein KUTeg_014482 [Tegillarca granosa]|uniref:P2X purinoreceptor 7 intracellular domain-containing protein n=1 Tax=Tegillarca granosa TaxID=220873 RepID=A0ABQ9EXG7_TEGGR|nr:hypothetical protein KUTeg_014482 [Tegillarca granosa]
MATDPAATSRLRQTFIIWRHENIWEETLLIRRIKYLYGRCLVGFLQTDQEHLTFYRTTILRSCWNYSLPCYRKMSEIASLGSPVVTKDKVNKSMFKDKVFLWTVFDYVNPRKMLCCTSVAAVNEKSSYYEYIQENGRLGENEFIHELYRYIAYRRFSRWIWHILGRKNRRILPACVVMKIREQFPSEEYCGFKYPA